MKKEFPELTIKEKNLLSEIIKENSISRVALQKKTNLKIANYYNTVDSLLNYGLIKKEEVPTSKAKGRPSEILFLNSGFFEVFHVMLSKTMCITAICRMDGEIIERSEFPMTPDLTAQLFIENCVDYYNRKKNSYNISYITFASGFWDKELKYTESDGSFYSYNIEAELSKACNLPIIADSIARSTALGIFKKRYYQKKKALVFFNISNGIGVGLVHPEMSENFGLLKRVSIEHFTLDSNGRQCSCGQRGCVIAYLGANNIVKRIKEEIDNNMQTSLYGDFSIKDVIEQSNNGDTLSRSVMKEAADNFAIVLRNLTHIFNFDIVSVGGTVTNNNKYFFEVLSRNIENEEFTLDIEPNYTLMTSIGLCYRLILENLSLH